MPKLLPLILFTFILTFNGLYAQELRFSPAEVDSNSIDQSDLDLIINYQSLYSDSDHFLDKLSLYVEFMNEFYDEAHYQAYNQQFLKHAQQAVKDLEGEDREMAYVYLGVAYNNEGYVYDVLGDFKKAREYYDKALECYVIGKEFNEKGTIYNNIGYLFKTEGRLDSAMHYFQKAKQIHNEAGDISSYSLMLNNIGFLHDIQGDKVKALIMYDSALKIQEKNNLADYLSTTYTNLAMIYGEFGDSLMEVSYLKRSYMIDDSLGDDRDVINTFINLGAHYNAFNRPDLALSNYKKAQIDAERLALPDQLGVIYGEIAKQYINQSQLDSATYYARKAIAISEEYELNYPLSDAYNYMANIYFDQGKFNESKDYAWKAYNLGKKTGIEDNQILSLKTLIKIYEQKKDIKTAYKLKKRYDSLFNVSAELEKQKKLYQLDLQRQLFQAKRIDSLAHAVLIEKSNVELVEKEAEISSVKQQRVFIGAGLLLSLTALFFFYRAYQRKKRDEITISQQKEEVSLQRDLAQENFIMAEKNRLELQIKNDEILDSILYARRLQEAVLPPQKLVKEWLTSSFILYKPKDIVSGDFYWMETAEYKKDGKRSNLIFFAVADCTGHGVPGAMVSVICAGALNRAVNEFDLTDVGEILNKVSELVIESFMKSETDIYDGMDIALCALDLGKKQLFYTGANNPLWVISKEEILNTEIIVKTYTSENNKELYLHEVKGQRRAVGKNDSKELFKTKLIQLVPGDAIYVFSDGYVDQFGGETMKKFKSKRLKELLLDSYPLDMSEQKELLDNTIEEWRGDLEQIDDICILGVKVNGKERANFTTRELEVLEFLREGLPSKLIADKMSLSSHTVDTYRRRLLAKTNTYNSTELLQYAKDKEII